MAAEEGDEEPALVLEPSAAGQEPPFVGPARPPASTVTPASPSPVDPAAPANNGDAETSGGSSAGPQPHPARRPQRVHLGRFRVPPGGGTIRITRSGRGTDPVAGTNATSVPTNDAGGTVHIGAGGTIRLTRSGGALPGPMWTHATGSFNGSGNSGNDANENNENNNNNNNNNSDANAANAPLRGSFNQNMNFGFARSAQHQQGAHRQMQHRMQQRMQQRMRQHAQQNPNNNNGAGGGGHRQHRVPIVGPMGFAMQNPMLPPLRPQPVPHQTTTAAAENGDVCVPVGRVGGSGPAENDVNSPRSTKDMKKFECAICFEYMDRPAGCGSCQSRFCQSCLQRVLREAASNRPPQSTDPPNSAKCPHCRLSFTLQSMTIDIALQNQISECTDTVTCPFAGCGTELRIDALKSHEETCPYVRLRCRHADWGCGWTGRKLDLERHEAMECEFRGGLGVLLERFRQGDARAGHVLGQHHMQISAMTQMASLHSRQLMMIRGKNAGNIVDVARLAYEVSMFPGRFSAMREIWSGMINQQEARCIVCNVMLLVPSLALVLRVCFRGFQLICNLRIENLSGDEAWYVADALLLSLIVVMLGILCLACFFIDAKGSTGWTIYNVRNLVPGQPILRDLAAICMAMMHFTAIEFLGLHPGAMLWQFVVVVTVGFSSFVSRIIEKNATDPLEEGIVASARAWPVVVFGLRYGFLTAMCGFAPTVNAIAMLRLFKKIANLSPRITVEDAECFLTQPGGMALWAFSSLVTAFVYGTPGSDFDEGVASWLNALFDLTLALMALVYTNALVFVLDKGGRRLGDVNFHAGSEAFMLAHRASGAVTPNLKPTPIGCAVFGVCSILLLCIGTG